MLTKETAYKRIAELVQRFEEQFDSYKKSEYNETKTRRDFIDPFFKALGWDIDNENGYAESYREVIHEDKVKVGKATKAPDYSFRLVGGKRLFFVEAKKPSVVVKLDILPAYQVRRYGWSAKLPISIITDFEEFAIYDCTKKPNPSDKASVARIKYFTFREYLKEFEFLWNTFSKERVLKGSFDKFIQGNANKKGTATVDKEFLQSLDRWRTYLATSISWNNKNLDEDEINFVVQQTIDRIIFLRIAEDRGVEPYGNLKEAIKKGDFYKNLFQQFQQADAKYNSGLFDFKKDSISKTLSVENKVLKTIINELYYPESPYEFSVLSVEILGSAYEQFLGKTITIDKAHRAKIEEKPEVRKAGGVYYTPQYIVEYIVKNTLGKLINSPFEGGGGMLKSERGSEMLSQPEGGKQMLKQMSPKEISKIKIVDPACGSGSFLIGAYQFLLDWHLEYYNKQWDMSLANSSTNNSPLKGGQGGANNQSRYRNKIIPYNRNLKEKARELRKKSTLSEVLLWQEIKNRKLGVQFHRQVPIDEYIVDFYCHEVMLAIEVDGGIHNSDEAREYDNHRQKRLEELGIRFIRFDNMEVNRDMMNVLRALRFWIEENKNNLVGVESWNSGKDAADSGGRNTPLAPLEGGREHLGPLDGGTKRLTRGQIPKELKGLLTPDGNLTTAEKKRILLNNIYGVDIDVNAVEVTKLSLLLKCMEGETEASIASQLSLFNERVLPTLDNNIKDGNSLIDTDFYDTQLDLGFEKKIKPFSWQKAFPAVFTGSNDNIPKPTSKGVNTRENPPYKGALPQSTPPYKGGRGDVVNPYKKSRLDVSTGFDIVIGNPPYVRQELLGEQKTYFQSLYKVYHGMADLYSYFIEKGIGLLNDKGIFGIIVANKWMRSNYGEPLRKWLKQQQINEIIDFGDLPVFENATTYPCILIAGKPAKNMDSLEVTQIDTLDFESLQKYVEQNREVIQKSSLDDSGWNLVSETESNLLNKLKQNTIPLGEYVKGKIYRGVLTGLNEAFVIDLATKERLIKENKRSAEIIKPFLAGRDVKRYQQPKSDKYLIFTRRGIDIDKYPAIKNYLSQFKKQLIPKPRNFIGDKWEGRKPGSYEWYEIQDAVDYYAEFEKPKIIYPNILKKPEFTFDENQWFTNQKCFIISLADKFLLGVLNSKLNHYLFEKYLPKLRGGFYEPSYVFFKDFPIKKIDVNDKMDVANMEEIVRLVDQLLQLNKEKSETKLQTKISQIEGRIDHCENRINEIVYQLYGLTEKEIGVIES